MKRLHLDHPIEMLIEASKSLRTRARAVPLRAEGGELP
jgi:hypothetical protein